MTRRGCIWGWLIGLTAVLVVVLVTIVTIESLMGQHVAFTMPGARVGLVRVEGIISDPRGVLDDLEEMEQLGVSALVVRIDSPGGGAAASQEIYERLVEMGETGLPIVASFGAIAASGGYYVSVPADTIVANPASLTGSIGVIMSFTNLEELFRKVGMSYEIVKSGDYKDIGSWSRAMTGEERDLLQQTVDDIRLQFVEAVSAHRGMTIEEVDAVADGRIMSGRQALAAGLVDTLGTLDDAVRIAGRMGGIEGKPRVQEPVKPRRFTLFDALTGTISGLVDRSSGALGAQYIYEPHK